MRGKNIIHLLIIQTKLSFIKLKMALFPMSLVIFMVLLFVGWWKNNENMKPTVLICNEEKGMLASLTINSILNNKVAEIVNFVTVDYKDGKKKVDEGEALLLVYIKKGTVDTLYQGKRAEINIYAKNENNDFTKLIVSYIKGFTDIINVSQNAGLTYMDVMYAKGMTEEERVDKFNELQASYVKLTLARNSIFSGEDLIMGISRENLRVGCYLLAIIFLVGISIGIIKNSEFLCTAMRQRLLLAGFSDFEIYVTVVIKIIIVNLIILIVFNKLVNWVG